MYSRRNSKKALLSVWLNTEMTFCWDFCLTTMLFYLLVKSVWHPKTWLFMISTSFNSISKVKNELLCIKKMSFGRRLCLIQFKLNSPSREFNRSWDFSTVHCVTGCSKLFCYKDLQNSTFGNIPHLVMCNYNRNTFPLHWQSTIIITNPYLRTQWAVGCAFSEPRVSMLGIRHLQKTKVIHSDSPIATGNRNHLRLAEKT